MALARISQAKNRMEGPESMRGTWNLRDEHMADTLDALISHFAGRGEEPKDFWSQSFCWGSTDLETQTTAPVRVRFVRPRQPLKRAAELTRRLLVQGIAGGESIRSRRIGHLTR